MVQEINFIKVKELFVKAKSEGEYNNINNYIDRLRTIENADNLSYQECLELTKTLHEALNKATKALEAVRRKIEVGKTIEKLGMNGDPNYIIEVISSSAKEAIWELFDRANHNSPHLEFEAPISLAIVPKEALSWDSIQEGISENPDVPTREKCQRFCGSNDIEINDDTRFINIIMYDPKDPDRPLQTHRFKKFPRYGELFRVQEYLSEYIPSEILAGHKEGDVIHYKETLFTTFMESDSPDMEPMEIRVDINYTVTLNQTDSIYSKHGSFENVYHYAMTGEVNIPSVVPILEFNATAFIIPNPAIKFSELSSHTQNYLRGMCELEEGDKIISLWLTNKEELNCENIARHGFIGELDDGREVWVKPVDLEYIPVKLLEGINEGGTVTFSLSDYGYLITDSGEKEKNPIDIFMKVNMTCQQKSFRYENRGNFEDVVRIVIGLNESISEDESDGKTAKRKSVDQIYAEMYAGRSADNKGDVLEAVLGDARAWKERVGW